MTRSFAIRRTSARLAAALAAALFIAFAPIMAGALAPAQAQVAVKAEFRTALEPHGTWRNSSKWGDVWVPADRPRNWQPYTVGHWVYTDDWGWYWIEDQAEAAWGVVAFHYGRWVMEEDVWVWVPGEEWGPGWVAWRHSNKRGSEGRRDSRAEATYVGWAAMPPDEMVEEIWEEPRVWVFVWSRDFTAPVVARVILPLQERQVAIRETVVINRTVLVREQRFAVNPGIPPVLIAAEIGRPLRSYEVRPVVLAGTVRLPGALEVRADELRSDRVRVTARETRTEFRPSNRVPEIQPLRPGEQGRYFDNPPRAVQRVQQGPQPTRGQGQPDHQQGQQQRDQQQQGQQGRDAGQPKQGTQGRDQGKGRDAERKDQGRGSDEQRPGTEGRGTDDQRQQGREGGAAKQQQKKDQSKQQKDQGRDGQSPQGTQGRGTNEQRQQRDRRDGAKQKQQQRPDQQGRDGDQQRVPQGTQGRSSDEQRQQDDRRSGRASDRAKASASDRAKPKEPQDQGRNDPGRNAAEPKGAPQGTQGRGAGEQRQRESAQPRPLPLPQSGTEGRGGSQSKGESRGVPKQPPQATEGRGGAPGGGGQPAGER